MTVDVIPQEILYKLTMPQHVIKFIINNFSDSIIKITVWFFLDKLI